MKKGPKQIVDGSRPKSELMAEEGYLILGPMPFPNKSCLYMKGPTYSYKLTLYMS